MYPSFFVNYLCWSTCLYNAPSLKMIMINIKISNAHALNRLFLPKIKENIKNKNKKTNIRI